jgi:hypothetical protein
MEVVFIPAEQRQQQPQWQQQQQMWCQQLSAWHAFALSNARRAELNAPLRRSAFGSFGPRGTLF